MTGPRILYWVLDGHELRGTNDVTEWGRMFDHDDGRERRVGFTKIGDAEVSTVFLGIDHRFGRRGPPLLFETMIFGGPHSDEQWRYPTWDAAAAGHARIVASLEAGAAP